MSYPENDKHFDDSIIKSVSKEESGWSITRADGWSFFVPANSPVEPKEGMPVRMYGNGAGYLVRGLFLDGQQVFYRTEAEQKEKSEIDSYGADCAEWLARWDAGRSVWTIEMGGMGPGYEQAIQIAMAENLRHMLAQKYDASFWEDREFWKKDREQIEQAGYKNPVIDKLGLSGAQWGAALNLAARLYMRGPRSIMGDEAVKDRHIQVSKNWPQAA